MEPVSNYARKWLARAVGPQTYKAVKKLYKRTLSPDSFLRHTSGVIHVGANLGQEREIYDLFNLDVIWVEPIPEVFDELTSNISGFPRQRAYRYLLTDVDGGEYTFHVANNTGEASSVFEFSKHKDMWPETHYSRDLHLRSTTLAALVRSERIDLRRFQTLVLDTQGSELLVLKGCADLISRFRFIRTEAADFEAYKGCCTADELTTFVGRHGFSEQMRIVVKSTPGIGTYWNILYRRGSMPQIQDPLRP